MKKYVSLFAVLCLFALVGCAKPREKSSEGKFSSETESLESCEVSNSLESESSAESSDAVESESSLENESSAESSDTVESEEISEVWTGVHK